MDRAGRVPITNQAPAPRLLRELTGESDGSIPSLLRARASATPDAPYIRWAGAVLTYAETLREAECFAGYLKLIGRTGPEHRVATYLPNCPQALSTWFGTQIAGAIYVPLNHRHKGTLLTDLLTRSRARVLVTERAAVPDLLAAGARDLDHVVFVDDVPSPPDMSGIAWDEVASAVPWAGIVPSPQDVGAILYTSGSTGRSKAVLMPHNQQVRGAAHVADSLGMTDTDVWHAWQPHFHMMGQLYVILASMVAGGSIALQTRFSRSGFWRQVNDGGCTLIGGMATVMRMVWSLPDEEASLANPARLALVSGAFSDLHEAFEARYGVRIVDCFGMTEAEPVTLPSLEGSAPGRHGRADGDFEVSILDDNDSPVATDVVGEIACRPRVPGVMFLGYEEDAERTVETWRNLWFHTGDLGFVDEDGYLHFLDRRMHGIRRLGENISSSDMEAILQRHEDVADAVALPVPRPDGDDDIKVAIVLRAGAALSCEALYLWCEREMAKFMVPRYIEVLAELPRLALGKVDRAALDGTDGAWDSTRQLETTLRQATVSNDREWAFGTTEDTAAGRSARFEFPVERGKILELARATATAQDALENDGAVAPPTILLVGQQIWGFSFEEPGNSPLAAVDLDASKALHLEEDYEYFGPPPRAGDRLIGQLTLLAPVTKVGRRAGRMTIFTTETSFWDENGKLVARARRKVASIEEPDTLSASLRTPGEPA